MQKSIKPMQRIILKKLDTLDKQYANTIQNAKYKAILFGDRFPFRYMADDYDLKYYAAFCWM